MRTATVGELTVSAQGLGCMGTKRVKWLEQNVAALDITLTDDELAALEPLAGRVVGGRY
jgi:aryl-alcohol dehydrogenase-like predicted oxidoreductase